MPFVLPFVFLLSLLYLGKALRNPPARSGCAKANAWYGLREQMNLLLCISTEV